MVAVASLLPGDSPRLGGRETGMGADNLAVQDVPPILVQRASMRIIDGARRVRAAVRSGRSTVAAQFFDCSDEDAFVLAVRENTTRGGPLDQDEREHAAERVLRSHPLWSDRSIAAITGLGAAAVGAIRRRAAVNQPAIRYGRDGRARPVDTVSGRRRAEEIIAARPTATLRDIARDAGISIGTARDVRMRLARGEDALTPRQRQAELAAAVERVADIYASWRRLNADAETGALRAPAISR